MSRQRLDDAVLFGAMFMTKLKLKALTLTLGGNLTLDADSPPVVNLNLGGAARTLTLPTEEEGLAFLINNIDAGANDITIKNPATTTIGTCSQNEMMLAICAGGVWYCRLLGTTT